MKLALVLVPLFVTSTAFAEAQLKQGTFTCNDTSSYKPVPLVVKAHPTKPNKAVLNWEGKDRILHREKTTTGAVRYAGAVSKLLYIQTPHHSILLDDAAKRVILSDCVK